MIQSNEGEGPSERAKTSNHTRRSDRTTPTSFHDSIASLDADDFNPPAETTRPQRPWQTSRTRSNEGLPATNFAMIQQEQANERAAPAEIDITDMEQLRIEQEEEMVRMAMEKSLTELSSARSFNQSFHSINSDYIQSVQAEAERTEAIIETPHSEASVRAPLRRTLSRSSTGSNGSRRSLDNSRRSVGRSSSHGGPNRNSIRIGPLPAELLKGSSHRSLSGAEAVLEVARQNLSPEEVELIAKALRKGSKKTNNDSSNNNSLNRGSGHSNVSRRSRKSRTSESSSDHDLQPFLSSSHSINSRDSSLDSRNRRSPRGSPAQHAAPPPALSKEELAQIQQALGGDDEALVASNDFISPDEAAAIERAILEADREEEMRSLQLAMQIQEQEEAASRLQRAGRQQQQGNVRTMTRQQYEQETRMVGAYQELAPPPVHPLEEVAAPAAAGYRMNTAARQEWARRDRANVIGPNDEIRTKHDSYLDAQSNAHRLGLDDDGYGMANVGNKAYNSFMQSVRGQTKKGVMAHGTGRAGSDADATKGGAMDPNVRVQISKAINQGLIERCNGVVKEGKEAIVYHANQGHESEGYDVAIKVFKRIQEFKARGEYVDGDPRYSRENFRKVGTREQLELWTEKEFRNLTRANRAGVPVPTPLHYKDNVLFMRFLGTDGWPAPQLREVNIRVGSKKWPVLYGQVMRAIRLLYRGGRLVHGDLSEYNILVVPAYLVENMSPEIESPMEEVQAVLIDFGQSVDIRHEDSIILLQRDLERVNTFFKKQGVHVLGAEDSLAYTVDEKEHPIVF